MERVDRHLVRHRVQPNPTGAARFRFRTCPLEAVIEAGPPVPRHG